jgi:hypothetical protein
MLNLAAEHQTLSNAAVTDGATYQRLPMAVNFLSLQM